MALPRCLHPTTVIVVEPEHNLRSRQLVNLSVSICRFSFGFYTNLSSRVLFQWAEGSELWRLTKRLWCCWYVPILRFSCCVSERSRGWCKIFWPCFWSCWIGFCVFTLKSYVVKYAIHAAEVFFLLLCNSSSLSSQILFFSMVDRLLAVPCPLSRHTVSV